MKLVIFKMIAMIFTAFILSSCGIGGWWMNGDPSPEMVLPELSHWSKQNSDEKSRLSDWLSCGGNDAGMVKFSPPKNYKNPGYEDYINGDKEYDAAQACMMSKGYKYKGECRGAISRRLACRKR